MRMRKQAFLTHYEDIADDYRIIWYSDVNCANLYTHSHGYFEMYYLVSGRVVYCTGGCKFFLQPDDILFINRGQEHHPVLVEPSVPYERILLHVAPQTLRELSTNEIDLAECFTRNNFTVYHYPKNVRDSIRQFFDRLSALKGSGRFGQQILGRAYLAELFVEINQYNHNKTIFSFDEDTMNDQKMRMVRQYVRAHAAEPITVDDLADYLYMSRSHLMRQLRASPCISSSSKRGCNWRTASFAVGCPIPRRACKAVLAITPTITALFYANMAFRRGNSIIIAFTSSECRPIGRCAGLRRQTRKRIPAAAEIPSKNRVY